MQSFVRSGLQLTASLWHGITTERSGIMPHIVFPSPCCAGFGSVVPWIHTQAVNLGGPECGGEWGVAVSQGTFLATPTKTNFHRSGKTLSLNETVHRSGRFILSMFKKLTMKHFLNLVIKLLQSFFSQKQGLVYCVYKCSHYDFFFTVCRSRRLCLHLQT